MNDIIETYVRRNQDQWLELLKTIISIPSPTGREQVKGKWILQYLHSLGADGAYRDDSGNILYPCRLKKGQKAALYTAHMDTVFEKLSEIPIHQSKNILSAPSCSDNSASIAGLLFIIKMIFDLKLTPPQGILFAFDVGEEGLGNLKGIRQIMTDWAGRISEVVAVDCTFDTFVATAVGSRRYEVTIETPGGHSWMGFGNANAIAAAASVIDSLYRLSLPAEPKTTYNVGTISGGTTVNSIAAKVRFTVDLRSEDGTSLDSLDKAFHALLEKPSRDVRISLKSIGERPCSQVDQNPLVRRITAIRKQQGLTTTCIAGSTDANIPLSQGIPAISFGFCRSRREHTLEESLDLDTFLPGMMQMLAFMGL